MSAIASRSNRHWLSASVALSLWACGGGSDPSHSVDSRLSFPAPSAQELNAVMADWQQRDLSAREIELAHQDSAHPDYDLRIYRHRIGANTHYGAVTIPKSAAPGAAPVVLHADGLSQQDPNLDLGRNLAQAGELLQGAVYVVPTFRGRTMIYEGVSYPADGDACDAYDGAADDSIALLNVIASEVIAADMDRIMVRGANRGGTTALLLAVRDPRTKLVLAIAAPTDFNRLEVRVRYAEQYRCQFVDEMTPEQARQRILASSPLHFPIPFSVRKIFIFHGSADPIVPLWNAAEMAARLELEGVPLELRIFERYGHDDLQSHPDFRAAQRAAFSELFTLE